MDDPAPQYQPLARSRFGIAGTSALWLGSDHLLLVSNTFGVERYRRWFFKDIQSLTARRTAARLVWNLIAGICGAPLVFAATAAAFAIARHAAGSGDELQFALLFFCAPLALLCVGILVANTLLGPGCAIHVQTPMGVEKLSIPRRLNAFTRLAGRVVPLIEEAQRADK